MSHNASRDTASTDWWTSIRTTAFFAAAEQSEPEPEPVDPAAIELAEWDARRGELGLGRFDSDFVGIDNGGGLPDWRDRPEQAPTAMDEYAATRTAVTASSVFGCPSPQPRNNTSPWTSDGQPR